MTIKGRIAKAINVCLRPLGALLVHTPEEKPWDIHFRKWISEAKTLGKDPNDVGDMAWNDDPLKEALEKHYLPHIHPTSVVLELGPGTGRATRHLIGHCQEMILVDFSRLVCDWLDEYLEGKGRYRIFQIQKPLMPMVASGSVDVVLANGVIEHIGKDDLYFFLEEFARVLKPSGVVAFNFDNLMSPEGLSWYQKFRGDAGDRCLFRFYHPDVVRKLAEAAGFKILRVATSDSRFAFVEMEKPLREG